METCAMGVACLKFGVECLLLFSADRLCRCGSRMLGILISAVISAAHTAACLITEAAFLSKPLWRLLVLAIVVLIAFGLDLSALYRSAVYILLNTAIYDHHFLLRK